MTSALREKLTDLKDSAKVKAYGEPLGGSDVLEFGDYLLTFCIENILGVMQPTLAISRRDRTSPWHIPELRIDIQEVFGRPRIEMMRTYRGRGATLHYVFDTPKE